MLTDALNVAGMPLPPPSPSAPTNTLGRVLGGAPAAAPAAAPVSGFSSSMERWAEQMPPSLGTEEAKEKWALHLVNAEYARSKPTGFRRLLPSVRADYVPLLEPERKLNKLPFDT